MDWARPTTLFIFWQMLGQTITKGGKWGKMDTEKIELTDKLHKSVIFKSKQHNNMNVQFSRRIQPSLKNRNFPNTINSLAFTAPSCLFPRKQFSIFVRFLNLPHRKILHFFRSLKISFLLTLSGS